MRRLKSAQIPTIRALSNSDWDMDLASSTNVVKIKLGEILELIFYFAWRLPERASEYIR